MPTYHLDAVRLYFKRPFQFLRIFNLVTNRWETDVDLMTDTLLQVDPGTRILTITPGGSLPFSSSDIYKGTYVLNRSCNFLAIDNTKIIGTGDLRDGNRFVIEAYDISKSPILLKYDSESIFKVMCLQGADGVPASIVFKRLEI
jgi:hypothetical protein